MLLLPLPPVCVTTVPPSDVRRRRGPGVGSSSALGPSKYSAWLLVENPNRAIHRFDMRLMALSFEADEALVIALPLLVARARRRAEPRSALSA